MSALLNAMHADFERATGTWEIEWRVLPEISCYPAGALAQAKCRLSGLIIQPNNYLGNFGSMMDGLLAGRKS